MSLAQIFRVVHADPHATTCIFPDQRLERQIDGERWIGLHQRGSCRRIAEKDQRHRPHHQSDRLSGPLLVDSRKDGHSFLLKHADEAPYRLLPCSGDTDISKLLILFLSRPQVPNEEAQQLARAVPSSTRQLTKNRSLRAPWTTLLAKYVVGDDIRYEPLGRAVNQGPNDTDCVASLHVGRHCLQRPILLIAKEIRV